MILGSSDTLDEGDSDTSLVGLYVSTGDEVVGKVVTGLSVGACVGSVDGMILG